MAALPKKAKVVVVGAGGIVGACVVHHLIENGWSDIVAIDKSGIPTDIGSTAHASDFCFATSHDLLTSWTTMYSMNFYESMGHYERVGGLEVARVGDDERMAELKRRVDSGKAFGTNVKIISAAEAKAKFPLLEEDQIQGALWDPDAGLVTPRSQTVAGKLIDQGVEAGKLQIFANTSALELVMHNERITGVKTTRGTISADYVVVCAGLWGRLIAEMAGEDLPVMPVDHPLTFFGPYTAYERTGKEIGMPLLRDQGNSAYMRDTGDPKSTEGGQIEWGYYYEENPRLVHPRDILEKEQARLSPSQRDLELEDVMEPLERAMELTPILSELGYNESHSFNGLLQTSIDGGPSIGESRKLRGLWYGVGIWIKDGPGMGKLIADWMTYGRTHVDHNPIDYSRFNDFQLSEDYIHDRCWETAKKIYNPPVHPREPFANARGIRRSPFYEREVDLGGYFMELGGWERAHGYASNEHLLEKHGNRVPVRENEWDNRHFWRVSNAEHLEMSEDCGIINLSHFHITDIEGPDHVELMEWLCAAKIGGEKNIGKGIYTHMLDDEGNVRADFTVFRMDDRCRLVNGADAGPRDCSYMQRVAQDKGLDVSITDVSEAFTTIGIWGPNARENLQKIVEEPDALTQENFPFAAIRPIKISGKTVSAFRISYVGEQGWELHMAYEDGLAVWDALRSQGITAVGVETYANSRRLEKSLRLQNADLHTQYNLLEADLARPKVKAADFRGKAKHIKYHERENQPAMLCTLVMADNLDKQGVARYPVGTMPVMDPKTGETLVDELGRRSYTTSVAFGPSIGQNIALAYLPWEFCQEGQTLNISYFDEIYPVVVAGVGYTPLYDPQNLKPRS
ncbi:4-methylaminobutanoate oxidase (formaldehyde-forming) [Pseudovibrio axinellae]|uniref:4-methylaminobutanoate oxidase (Formaldehyde-forming) n=1 Tax=Pseudovibrio axinellae TaxID=989403 RepID=A0A165VTG6_9HYPH|nr:FAD-dependent oxidoreductase [Pseudovibrio axinellae]KZL15417.1 4-methylaminobutanoate oxidase (formaldehyde-forming) [Pseudovibrio axinellae]SER55583.1 Glycine cleavage system T protein (aminomethyltransferase) [Pseudovibrio axinellae]